MGPIQRRYRKPNLSIRLKSLELHSACMYVLLKVRAKLTGVENGRLIRFWYVLNKLTTPVRLISGNVLKITG